MKESVILFLIAAAVILLFFWNEGDDCQPTDANDYCDAERESRQF